MTVKSKISINPDLRLAPLANLDQKSCPRMCKCNELWYCSSILVLCLKTTSAGTASIMHQGIPNESKTKIHIAGC